MEKFAGNVGDVHISTPLTNLAISFGNLGFIASELMPIIPVLKEADYYYVFQKEELRRINSLRVMGAEAHEVDWAVTSETYKAEEYALRMLVPDRLVTNADPAVRPEMNTAKKLLAWILLDYEKRVQALVQEPGGVLASATPAEKWDGTSPVIETDVDTAKKSVRQNAGAMPNTILMSADVKDVVKKDSTVRNLIRYTMPAAAGLLTSGELPPVLWNLKTVIGNSVENTANQGQTNVIADVWNDNVLVSHIDPTPSLEALTHGFTMRVRQNGKLDVVVSKWREDKRKGNMIEVSVIQAEEICADECGYLITDALS